MRTPLKPVSDAMSVINASTVYLNIRPRPKTFADTSSILHGLSRFGEVAMFRSLRFEYPSPAENKARIIYRHPDAARALLAEESVRAYVQPHHYDAKEAFFERASRRQAQPLQAVTTMQVKREAGGGPDGEGGSPKVLFEKERSGEKEPGEFDPETQQPNRFFTIIPTASAPNTVEYVVRQAFHGPFYVKGSMAQRDLERSVPLRGLSDVDLVRPPRLFRLVTKLEEEERATKPLMQVWREAVEAKGMRWEDRV